MFRKRSLELELVVALVVALRERERVLLHEAPHHLQVVGGAAHEESGIRREIRLLRLVVEDAHGEHVRLRLDALGERHHGVLHGRGAEHLAEAQHGDLLRARETLLADGQNGVGVHLDARLLHLKPKRLRQDGHRDLTLLAEVLVPEPPRVRLFQLVRRARREAVQLRGLHERLDVLS